MTRIFKQPVQCKFSAEMHHKVKDALTALGYELRAVSNQGLAHMTWFTNWQSTNNRATNSIGLIEPAERYVVPDENFDFFIAVAAISCDETNFYPGEVCFVNDRGVDELFVVKEKNPETIWVRRIEERNEPGYFSIPRSIARKATIDEIEDYFNAEMASEKIIVEARDNQTPEFGECIQVWNDSSPQRFNRFYVGTNRNGKIVTVSDNPNEFSEARNSELNFFDNWAKFGSDIEVPFAKAREYLAELVFGPGIFPEQIKFR